MPTTTLSLVEQVGADMMRALSRRDRETAALLAREYAPIAKRIDAAHKAAIKAAEDAGWQWRLAGVDPQKVAGDERVIARLASLRDAWATATKAWGKIAEGEIVKARLDMLAHGTLAAARARAKVSGLEMAAELPQRAVAAIIAQVRPGPINWDAQPGATLLEKQLLYLSKIDPDEWVQATDALKIIEKLAPIAQEEAKVGYLQALNEATYRVQAAQYPVAQVLQQAGGLLADAAADKLIDAVARGRNPLVVGRELADLTGWPLSKALTIARTEQLRAWRTASSASYRAANTGQPGVLQGWVWYTALDSRCCGGCLSQHGSVHPVDETMGTHPNCRCTMVPLPEGMDPPESGAAWLARQDAKTQDRILGRRGGDALRRGDVELDDFMRTVDSPVWGRSVTQASWKQAQQNARMAGRGPTPPPTKGVETPPWNRTSAEGWRMHSPTMDDLYEGKVEWGNLERTGAKQRLNKAIKDRMLDDGFDPDEWHWQNEYYSESGWWSSSGVKRHSLEGVRSVPEDWRTFHAESLRAMEDETRRLIDTWAGSSFDDSKVSISLQERVRQLLAPGSPSGIDVRGLRGSTTVEDIQKYIDMNKGFMDPWIRAVYANTQDDLRRRGITSLELFRGCEVAPKGMRRLSDISDLLPLGYDDVTDLPAVPCSLLNQPLSSWAADGPTSRNFGANIVAANVPAERVFSTAWTGPGCLNEEEVVVMFGPGDTAWFLPRISEWSWQDYRDAADRAIERWNDLTPEQQMKILKRMATDEGPF